MKIVDIGESALKKGKEQAKDNKKFLEDHGVFAIDVMGSVGSGKTSVIKQIVKQLKNDYEIGVIAGDLTTEIDARRLEEEKIPVVQAHTGRGCHLDPGLVRTALEKLELDELDIIFIENVGNLICPAANPLGVHNELVITSVTEGPYMIKKHPYIFQRANVVAMNKIDLAEAMKTPLSNFLEDIKELNPEAPLIGTNGITGEGVDELIKCMNLPQ